MFLPPRTEPGPADLLTGFGGGGEIPRGRGLSAWLWRDRGHCNACSAYLRFQSEDLRFHYLG